MKVGELRIGSTYHSVKFNTPVTLELSDLVELHNRCEGSELTPDIISQMLEPIPFTDEWLLKLSFKRLGNRNIWTKGKACVVLMNYPDIMRKTKGEVFFIGYKDMGNVIYHTQFELPYVHTLQNAFALTGEELTIKEKLK